MDNITVITLNANDEQVQTVMTVNELIHTWYHEVDIPTNDDTVVSCVLGETQLYFETFGELMQALTGRDVMNLGTYTEDNDIEIEER